MQTRYTECKPNSHKVESLSADSLPEVVANPFAAIDAFLDYRVSSSEKAIFGSCHFDSASNDKFNVKF